MQRHTAIVSDVDACSDVSTEWVPTGEMISMWLSISLSGWIISLMSLRRWIMISDKLSWKLSGLSQQNVVFLFPCVCKKTARIHSKMNAILRIIIPFIYDHVIIKTVNSFRGEPIQAATTCLCCWQAKKPTLLDFENREIKRGREKKENVKREKWTAIGFLGQRVHWNSAMPTKSVDCPPLPPHPLLTLTRIATPLFRPHICVCLRRGRTRVSARTFDPRRRFSHSFKRFDWLRTSRELSGYCSFCTGPFWRIKGTLLSRSTLHPISFLLQSSLLSVVHSICFPCWKMYVSSLACAQYCL